MHVHIEDEQNDVPIDQQSVKRVVSTLLKGKGDEVAIHFVSEKAISDLHHRFFDDRSVTDCITLPIDTPGTKPYCVLGDVIVCPHVAKTYIAEHGGDVYREVTLYVVHGILHLLGYRDDEPNNRRAMRNAERDAMALLERYVEAPTSES